MLTTLLALTMAVLLAIGYGAVVSRVDDASVGRRQVDTWAVLAAFACLLFMGAGAADAAREAGIRRGQVARLRADLEAPPAVAVRHRRPSLRPGGMVGAAAAPPGTALAGGAVGGEPEPGAAGDPAPSGAPAAGEAAVPVDYSDPEASTASEAPGEVLSGPDAGASLAVSGPADVPLPPPLRGAWPAPTPRAVAYASPTPTRLPIQPLPPTPPPPTESIRALPTATPHCGEPSEIAVSLQIERAEAERRDDELVVRYVAAFANRSAFPVTVADLSVTALSGSSGSELYGHELKPDMLLPPSDRVVVEGAVKLDKAPSPFGTTELCIAFVGETCGRRQPYEVQRRCITVRGF